MDPEAFDADAYAEHAAALLGLALDPAWRPGISASLRLTGGFAAQLLAFPLAPDEEPAPVFEP